MQRVKCVVLDAQINNASEIKKNSGFALLDVWKLKSQWVIIEQQCLSLINVWNIIFMVPYPSNIKFYTASWSWIKITILIGINILIIKKRITLAQHDPCILVRVLSCINLLVYNRNKLQNFLSYKFWIIELVIKATKKTRWSNWSWIKTKMLEDQELWRLVIAFSSKNIFVKPISIKSIEFSLMFSIISGILSKKSEDIETWW